jgi:seryl-tRNA synthetase
MIDFEHRLTECVERSKSNTHRLDELEKRQNDLSDLVGTVKVLASREERVEEDVKEIKTEVKKINEKPAKRWETVVTYVIAGIVAAVIGYIFGKLGM